MYATSVMLEITRHMCGRGQAEADRVVIHKVKSYKLQLSALRKAIFTGVVAFDSHQTPGRHETSGSRFLLSVIEI